MATEPGDPTPRDDTPEAMTEYTHEAVERFVELEVMPGSTYAQMAHQEAASRGVPLDAIPFPRITSAKNHQRGPYEIWRWEWTEFHPVRKP